jgi:FkbM family methyltransferase
LLYSQRVGARGEVHAFEILQSIVDGYLDHTIRANDLRNVATHAVGLSDRKETLQLPVGETLMTSQHSPGQSGQRLEACSVVRLDDYAREQKLAPPAFMKIDIEKAEMQCLRGAEGTIREARPRMMIEFHTVDLLREGFALLNAWGYDLHTQRGEAVSPTMLRSLDWFHESVLCLPRVGAKG